MGTISFIGESKSEYLVLRLDKMDAILETVTEDEKGNATYTIDIYLTGGVKFILETKDENLASDIMYCMENDKSNEAYYVDYIVLDDGL